MKILYFDCFSGVSGDMMLGSLLDLGIDKELFLSELNKLNIEGYSIQIEKKVINGIVGTDVIVMINEDPGQVKKRVQQHEHEHEHLHSHTYHHPHVHDAPSDKKPEAHFHRNLFSIERLIDVCDLKPNVKEFSKRVFREIAKAEAKVHNKDINDIHFHEVGAIDSIVDIVGVAICVDLLGITKVFSSPLHDGFGFVECQHGTIPVPVPAVMEMLTDSRIPFISENINTELVTPTGMGLIKCLAGSYGIMPAMIVDRIGYGTGKKETGKFNALRAVMGHLLEKDEQFEEITILETNIDNMNPEILGFTMEKLFEQGALDVFYTPIYMKKSRPAFKLTVLAKTEDEKKLLDIILKETTTLGVRRSVTQRYCMDRKFIKVNTEIGEVSVKVSSRGNLHKMSPEYEDCRELANKSGLSLLEVYDLVRKKYNENEH